MKSKDIYRAMSGIKSQYIEDAAPKQSKKNPMNWTRWAALAACLCLVFSATVALILNLYKDNPPLKGQTTRMTVDINPSIEFIVDAENKVVSVTALNDDGSILIAGETFVGKTSEEAVEMTIQLSTEMGYLVKGEGTVNENDVSISVSGNTEYAKQLKKSVEKKAENLLAKLDVNAQIKMVEAMNLEALKALVNANDEYTEEELNAMTEEQLYDALALQRVETALLLTEEMREAYYEAKEYEIRFAEREATLAIIDEMNDIYGLLLSGYSAAVDSYSKGIEALVQAKYDCLVSPDSAYQKALADLRNSKEEWLKERNYVATLDINGEEYALASVKLQASEESYNKALATLETAGEKATKIIDSAVESLELVEAKLIEIENKLPESIEQQLKDKAAETEEKVNKVKDGFFAEFEAAHKADIEKMTADLLAEKEALKNNIKYNK